MLKGINPLLTGELLAHLDSMGHSDAVVIADANFPASALARRLVKLPNTSTPEVSAAIRSVLPLDDVGALELMATPEGKPLVIHRELESAADLDEGQPHFSSRGDFYTLASDAYLIVQTGETRRYANAMLRKGLLG